MRSLLDSSTSRSADPWLRDTLAKAPPVNALKVAGSVGVPLPTRLAAGIMAIIFWIAGEVHNVARMPAVLRWEGRVVDLVFRQRVNRRLKRDLVLHVVIEVDTVNQPVGGVFALARRVDSERALPAQRRGEKTICGRCDCSRSEQTEVREVSPVQRNLLHR